MGQHIFFIHLFKGADSSDNKIQENISSGLTVLKARFQ